MRPRLAALEPTFKEKTEALIQRLDKIFDLKTIAPSGVKKVPRQQRLARLSSEDSDFSQGVSAEVDDEDRNETVRPCIRRGEAEKPRTGALNAKPSGQTRLDKSCLSTPLS